MRESNPARVRHPRKRHRRRLLGRGHAAPAAAAAAASSAEGRRRRAAGSQRHPHHDRHAACRPRLRGLREADDAEPRCARGEERRLRARVLDRVVHGQERRARCSSASTRARPIATAATSTRTSPKNVFVAERLHDAGVRTFGAASHWYFAPWSGLSQGIDVWDMSAKPSEGQGDRRHVDHERQALRRRDPPPEEGREHERPLLHLGPLLRSARAVHAARRRAGFARRRRRAAPQPRAIYDGEVWFTDKHVGRVLDFIASQPWGDAHGDRRDERSRRGLRRART